MVDLLERLNVLMKLEQTVYKAQDYLSPELQKKLERESFGAPPLPCSSLSTSSSSSASGINELWREKICEWSYQVVDHFDFSREVVNISISLLDRYLSTRIVNKKLFQLAAMTTLYLAIKLYEPGKLSMRSMIELSRGYFTVEQLTAMELAILQSLSWHVHPPTSCCVARHFLHMIPSQKLIHRQDISDLARFLTELSVIDYFFVTKRTSSIALAGILNAMQILHLEQYADDLLKKLARLDDFDPYDPDIAECRQRLHQLYEQGEYDKPQPTAIPADSRTDTVSPVCVSEFSPSQ